MLILCKNVVPISSYYYRCMNKNGDCKFELCLRKVPIIVTLTENSLKITWEIEISGVDRVSRVFA